MIFGKKPLHWALPALLAGALFCLTACGAGDGQAETLSADLESVDVVMYEETQTLDGGAVADVSYPLLSAETEESDDDARQVVEKLNGQFAERADAFVEQAREQGSDGGSCSYIASVEYNQDGLLSVVELESFGGSYQKYAATYSLSSGEKMTLGQVLGMDEEEAAQTVAKQFDGVIQTDPDTFNADAREYVSSHIDQIQFYRCSEGLDVFFQAGEVVPKELGVLEIVIQ